jgi:threonylcarbamoyladenosine tRNA methylthiotransferase MtaB
MKIDGGFHTVTLGCKLNQFDTAAIEGELCRRGLAREADPSLASIIVVNTCTVTGRADADARKRIRALRRENPSCRLLVTGCYAEGDPEAIRRIPGVDLVFGNRDKPRLPRTLDDLGIGTASPAPGPIGSVAGDRGCDAALELPPALHFGDRSRAFLKVQEGCRLACSYCVIPAVRGPSRSVPLARVERAARSLYEAGYREIVLTGINVGDYGRDLEPRLDLATLLRRLLSVCGPNRIRLNSLEPLTITDEIVELMAGDPRLAPHVQVPLQSGSPTILRAMRRNYRLEQYRHALDRLRRAVPEVGLGADVIVGFPGESEALFRQTYDFIAGSPLNYLHVFAWSPRPGTPAAGLPGRVHGSEVRRRSSHLRELGNQLSHRFRAGLVGRRLDAVTLCSGADGAMRALTGNFIEVALEHGTAARGEVLRVRLVEATPRSTWGRAEGPPDWAGDRPTTATA